MAGRVSGKVALVTGGASGIGRGCAEKLAAEGAFVVVTDIQDALGEEVVAGIKKAGGQAEYRRQDVTDEDVWIEIVDGVKTRHGRLDFLINNAGIGIGGSVLEMTLANWPADRDQPGRRVPGDQAFHPADARLGAGGEHRQHLVGGGPQGLGQPGRLLRHQGRRAAVHQGGGDGVRQRQGRHPGELRPPGPDRNADLADRHRGAEPRRQRAAGPGRHVGDGGPPGREGLPGGHRQRRAWLGSTRAAMSPARSW